MTGDSQYCISVRHTTQRCDTYVTQEVAPASPAPAWHSM